MKLIEVMCSVAVLAFFFGICASAARPVERLVKESECISRELSRDRFIVKSFRRLCRKNVGRAAFDDWIRVCNGLYPDGHISVTHEGVDADGRIVFSCAWNASEKQRRVFAALGKEN